MASGNQLIQSATGNQPISSVITCLQVQIYLLQQIAGNTMTGTQLTQSIGSLGVINDVTTAQQVIIFLLSQIQAGGSGGAGNLYASGSPVTNNTPGVNGQFYTDSATGNIWAYFQGAWQPTGIQVP